MPRAGNRIEILFPPSCCIKLLHHGERHIVVFLPVDEQDGEPATRALVGDLHELAAGPVEIAPQAEDRRGAGDRVALLGEGADVAGELDLAARVAPLPARCAPTVGLG